MANVYIPDRWCIIHLGVGKNSHYRVFGNWIGGYLNGDSWKINSGIESVTIEDDVFVFKGTSGSEYKCVPEFYGTTIYGHGVLSNFIKVADYPITVIPDTVDFTKIDYSNGAKIVEF